MMKTLFCVLALAPWLAGCGIPDLVAHTVKAVEKSQRTTSQPQASQASSQPQAPQDEEPPPPLAVPVRPVRASSSVTVEELPAAR